MRINKAVITAASRAQRTLPLQAFVDRNGQDRTALQIIINEVVSAGVDQICIVVCPGDQQAYAQCAGDDADRLHFVEQDGPRGYGHALSCARAFVGDEPFLHLVNDHLYISHDARTCAQQLVEVADSESCSVSAVQPTHERMLAYYGTIGGRRVPMRNLYEVDAVIEKPTPTEAEQRLIVPGLRAGHYLCLFGMHVLAPGVMDVLGRHVAAASDGDAVDLTGALDELAGKERYLALEIKGLRYNIGVKYGLLSAQLALALHGDDREEILAHIVEIMAARQRAGL